MRHGFSLVELSIVLVILGLLTGGILAGQNLIRASELRAVTTEYERYVSAVNTFRDKYFAIPGDMRNATDFWGIAAGSTGNDTTCRNTDQTAAATCNGSGNGRLDSTQDYESFLFWKHLANAGLIEGAYSGTYANGSNPGSYTFLTQAVPGWNMPLSKLNSGTWHAGNFGSWNVSIQKFHGIYPVTATEYYHSSLMLLHRGQSPGTGAGGPLSPSEAWNIDTKIDDGRPGSGKLEALRGGSSTAAGPCLTTGIPTTAEYDLDDDISNACVLVFVNAFL